MLSIELQIAITAMTFLLSGGLCLYLFNNAKKLKNISDTHLSENSFDVISKRLVSLEGQLSDVRKQLNKRAVPNTYFNKIELTKKNADIVARGYLTSKGSAFKRNTTSFEEADIEVIFPRVLKKATE